jgi:DNA-binding transcriptional regulator YbjK
MATRAQLSQERSRLRRDELLAAAIELFAEGGSRAITHRAVAARAGLPPATTTYYFESIDDLIREALGSHIDQWSRDLEALATIDSDAEVSLDDTGAFIAHIFAARPPQVAALELAIFLAASRSPGLQDNATRAMRALEALAAQLLGRVGVRDPGAVATSIIALILGTALRRQSGLYSEDAEAQQLASAIRDLVAAHTIGTDGVDRTIAGLREAQP